MTSKAEGDLKIYGQPFLIDESYLIPKIGQIDLGKLIYNALEVSNAHDQLFQKHTGKSVKKETDVWVITQYLINMYDSPKIGEEVRITTRVIEANRFLVRRYFTVEKDGRLLMDLHARFAVINFEERTLGKIDPEPIEKAEIIDDSIERVPFQKLAPLEESAANKRIPYEIKPSDIDMNEHVNNLAYLSWCYHSLDADFLKSYAPIRIEVKYGKELRPEHQVEILTLTETSANEAVTSHSILNTSNQNVACDVRITWQKVN